MYRSTFRQAKKPYSQVQQPIVSWGRRKQVTKQAKSPVWEPSGVLKVQTHTGKGKNSESQGIQSGMSLSQLLERPHQHKQGVEDLFVYELQHVKYSHKALRRELRRLSLPECFCSDTEP